MDDANYESASSTRFALHAELSSVLISLLKYPLYAEERPELWGYLLKNQIEVKQYFEKIGLKVHLSEGDGFAFLRQLTDEISDQGIPRLLNRRPMGFGMSILCLLLRKWYLEHEVKGAEIRAIISDTRIREEMALYLKGTHSEARQRDLIDGYINQVIKLGFLRSLKDNSFEIVRIVKATLDTNWLENFDEHLKVYLGIDTTEITQDAPHD